MLRTATRPRFVALLAVALGLATLCAWLGDWQLGRARDEASRRAAVEALAQPVTPLAEVLEPAEPVTAQDVRRLVTVDGLLQTDEVLRVPGRDLDGEDGAWFVAPMVVEGSDGTLPVVLGWLPDGADPPSLAGGQTEVVGRLEQSEPPTGVVAEDVRRDRAIESVSSADLVNLWEPPLYTAYLALTDPPAPLRAVPGRLPGTGFDLQNLSYALQWWVFAGFALFFWWRLVRDAHLREAEQRQQEWAT